MDRPKSYSTPAGVEAAIKSAAHKAAAVDPSIDIPARIRLEYFNRFLSRVFSDGNESEWLLKGGTGMLARVPSTRATNDVDLYRGGFTLDQALTDLRRLAAVDLGDHFEFVYQRHSDSIGGDEQPYIQGYAVHFDVLIGGRRKSNLRIDLSTGTGVTAEISTLRSASALELPQLVSYPYRVYPVVDQIADKVCATIQTRNGRSSSREKDLVDLVVLAVTQDVAGNALRLAILTEGRRRQMESFNHFSIPAEWGTRYAKEARMVPYCANFGTADLARDLMKIFIDPAFDESVNGKTWRSVLLAWV